jgi:hypothetical protein
MVIRKRALNNDSFESQHSCLACVWELVTALRYHKYDNTKPNSTNVVDIERPPGLIGENSPSQGYPTDKRGTHMTKWKNKINKKMYKKIQDNQPRCDTASIRIVKNNFKIAQINVEGLTRAKADILGKIFGDMDVFVLQETHIPDGETNRLKINDFYLVHHIGHNKHGLATYVSQNKSFQDIEQVAGNEHTVGIRIGNLTIFNVYKPPPSK